MSDYSSLNHTKWECKYHIVFIPKCRRKALYGKVRESLREILHALAQQRESKILEGHLCPDHVHMLIRIPPKHSVSHVVGYIKGKSAIRVARDFMVTISGLAATLFRRWAWMSRPSGNTFKTRSRTTGKVTNSVCFKPTNNLTN